MLRQARAPSPRLLVIALCLLALGAPPPGMAAPRATASAAASSSRPQLRATLVVDDLRDDVRGSDRCNNDPSDCPLRKAIELANQTDNTIITFAPSVFPTGAQPIQLNSPLEPLDRPGTQVVGTGATVKITFSAAASNKETIFRLQDDDIVLAGLTLYGATQANVRVFQRSDRQMTVRNNLIGTPTSGSCLAGPPTLTGIEITRYVSDPVNAASAVYVYGNRVECHDSTTTGTGGIIVRDGFGVSIGSNGTESGGIYRNTLRRNRNGVGMMNTQASLIIANTVITNTQNGIFIDDASTSAQTRNVIDNNLIGTSGISLVEGNGNNGIALARSPHTVIKNNVIAGNKGNGISMIGDQSDSNIIESNFIGVASNRQTIIPNGRAAENASNGIFLGGGADNNTIGGTEAAKLNLIGGNRGHGILIDNSDNNLVLFNDIGFASANNNLPLPNGGAGIKLMNTATANTIGPQGTEAPLPLAPQANFIWQNVGAGIEINGADGNKVYGNSLRFNAKGIQLINADRNEIYRVRIVENEAAGISEESGSDTNFWSEISTNNNAGGGIDKTAGTPNPGAPQIASAQRLSATSYQIRGVSESNAVVEIYLGNMTDRNEGGKFIGRTTAAGTSWSLDVTIPSGTPSLVFLATQTLGSGTNRRTSEFSGLYVPKFYVPLLRKP